MSRFNPRGAKSPAEILPDPLPLAGSVSILLIDNDDEYRALMRRPREDAGRDVVGAGTRELLAWAAKAAPTVLPSGSADR